MKGCSRFAGLLVLPVLFLLQSCTEAVILSPVAATYAESATPRELAVPAEAVPALDPEAARLIYYRPQKLLGLLAEVTVRLTPGDPGVATLSYRLRPGNFFIVDTWQLNVTQHLVQKGYDTPVDSRLLQLEKGRVYMFRLGLKPTHTYLKPVSPEQAVSDGLGKLLYDGYMVIGPQGEGVTEISVPR